MMFNPFYKKEMSVQDKLLRRIEGLEQQIISIKYPNGFEIGSIFKVRGFGNIKGIKCFVASNIYMKYSTPHIDIFVPELRPPSRTVHVDSLI